MSESKRWQCEQSTPFRQEACVWLSGPVPIFWPHGLLSTWIAHFRASVRGGCYEREVVDLILALVEPETTYFDVGTNIGLLSVPVLAACPSAKVVSIEVSPDTLPYLRRTHLAAERSNKWTIVEAAVGSGSGEVAFWSAGGAMGAFDGLRDTGRGGAKKSVPVATRTLDEIWRQCGSPLVSVIKMDIEGGEHDALKGATELISQCKPALIIEWNREKSCSVRHRGREYFAFVVGSFLRGLCLSESGSYLHGSTVEIGDDQDRNVLACPTSDDTASSAPQRYPSMRVIEHAGSLPRDARYGAISAPMPVEQLISATADRCRKKLLACDTSFVSVSRLKTKFMAQRAEGNV